MLLFNSCTDSAAWNESPTPTRTFVLSEAAICSLIRKTFTQDNMEPAKNHKHPDKDAWFCIYVFLFTTSDQTMTVF